MDVDDDAQGEEGTACTCSTLACPRLTPPSPELLLARLGKPGCCSPTTSPRLAHAALCRNRLHTGHAHNVFDVVPVPDHRQCSALLRARTASGDHAGSASLLRVILRQSLRPDRLALAAAIKLASALLPDGAALLGTCLHGFVVRAGHAAGAAVAKAVMDMYARRGALTDARRVFDEMSCCPADAVCWNILITGSSRAGLFDDVFRLFRWMLACGVDESMPTAVTVAVVIPMGSTKDDPIKIEDSETDSESDMPNQLQPVQQYIERGPCMLADGPFFPFDKHCVWGNHLRLDEYQIWQGW